MCAKQCRDANGFKCHCTGEAHLRQMEIFGHNQGRFISGYSEEFQKDFLNLMATSHRNSRVCASIIYNEYIGNKSHVHMNSTKWTTLTEFVKYLAGAGHSSTFPAHLNNFLWDTLGRSLQRIRDKKVAG